MFLYLPPGDQQALVLEAWRGDGSQALLLMWPTACRWWARVPGITLVPSRSLSSLSWGTLLTWWHFHFTETPFTGDNQSSICPASCQLYVFPALFCGLDQGHFGQLGGSYLSLEPQSLLFGVPLAFSMGHGAMYWGDAPCPFPKHTISGKLQVLLTQQALADSFLKSLG